MLIEIYEILSKHYGRQNWWPIVENGKCLYKEEFLNRERTEEEIFEIIVGAILTQNTAWNNVVKSIIKLKERGFFSIEKIISAPLDEIATLLVSSGYFNQKAKKIKEMCNFLKNEGGIEALKRLPLEILRKKFLSVWGVGPETADSIILYAFNHPVFVVDAYTKRIFSRLGYIDEKMDYEEIRRFFETNLRRDVVLFKEYHALIVEFGKTICRKKSLCERCFIKQLCRYPEVESA